MNCAGSERGENSKGFDCRNMGEVLGKECVKDEPFTYSSQEKLREVGEVPAGPNEASENESCKDVSVDPEEDFSWLLSYNSDEFITETCRCEGCLKRNESYNNEKKNAKLMLSSWRDFQSHIKYVYNYPVLKDAETPTPIPIEENERLYEMTQILRLCDPYQLFYKIEDEIRSVVLEIQSRHLNLLRDESNPNLAEEFVAGIIREYVKLLAGAYLISPAIDFLLKSQLKRFGLSWGLLNKHLYQSLVYAHCEVQENLPQFVSEFKSMQPMSDYHRDIVKQYLLFVDEMALIGADWESVSPRIQEFKNMKTKELETLNGLQDALKSFFALKINSVNGIDGLSDPTGKKNSQYCPNCLTMRGCPCDECTVTHILSCEGMDSPPVSDLPVSRSRSPVKDKEVENKNETAEEEQRSCECHACTVPPPELMDCSVTFSQLTAKNSYGEGFHLYPHIHGTVTETLYEAENMSNIYGNHQTASESVYPHLYNLHNQSNSIPNISQQINRPTAVPNRPQIAQPPSKIQPQPPISPQKKRSQLVSTTSENTQPQLPSCPPPLPPPPPQDSPKPAALPKSVRNEKATAENAAVKPAQPKQVPNPSNGDVNNKSPDVKMDEKKSQTGNKVVQTKESEAIAKAVADKTKLLANNKGTACVKSSLCGKCCLRHGPNCLKSPSCGKNTDKHLAAIARLGLTSSTNPRGAVRCAPGKENEHTHKPGKGHSCGKLKPHDISKRTPNGKINGQEPDDSSSQDDTCSERSNSTSASAQRDSRHCDCCYCEVFGHGVPSVAPVSRNYQEMRERLRIKLNMKKSAKCKAGPQAPQPDGKAAPGATVQDDNKKNGCGDKDLESLLRFIEGKTREACKDPKRLAKRARQRQKKLEEKERMEEEEAERKRVEAVKRAQAAKQNPPQQTNKQQQHPNNTKNTSNNSKNNSNRNNSNNCNNNNNNNNSSIGNNNNNNNNNKQARNSQTLNLSGLKSLVEKSDPNSGPKMVTIRRVMAPFSAEPTVTITLKGSTPDKDEFLFMLNNGSETYQTEEKENNKKSRKKKRKGKKEEEYYEEVEEEPEAYYEEEPEPVAEKTGGRKKRKNKNKEPEVAEKGSKSSRSENHHDSSKAAGGNVSKNSKNQGSKGGSDNNASGSGKAQNQSSNKGKSQNASASVKSQNSSSTQAAVSKGKTQKNVPVLKAQNENVKNRENSNNNNNNNNSNSKNTCSTKSSGSSNSNSNNKNNKNSNNSNNSNSGKGAVRNSVNNVNVVTKNSKTNQKQSVAASGGNQKSVVNQNGKNQPVSAAKQSKGKKSEEISQSSKSQTTQSKAKTEKGKKAGKDVSESVQKVQQKQETKQSAQEKQRQQESAKKSKSNPKPVTENRDLCSRFAMGGSYDRGKVVINTPSYRLSEVLSSIAPSPPPKEEINLENLRLPPGITITKIEGPITKSIRVNEQPSHVSKPVPSTPPIVVSTPALKQSHSTPPGNVIVVDTGRLKEVVKENSPNPQPDQGMTTGKRKKKKNKQNAENMVPNMEVPMLQTAKCGLKLSKGNPVMTKSGVTVISADEARKMVPNLENQQATIIKTSDNMVTIRSPAFQQAMNMHAYQNSQSFRPGINGYNNVTLFQNDVNRMTDSMGKLNINSDDKLARQMRNLDIKEGTRASEIFAQAMAVAGQNGQDAAKKKKKKRKGGGGRSDEKEVEPVESVFQPKDIDLENGDIDDDERELEAFKRFCLQSVPSERKNKVKVNLNIKDIVLKKKSSAIGCS